MKRLPVRQIDKMLMARWFRQSYPDTRMASVRGRRVDGTYQAAVGGSVVGNLTSAKGEYEAGTNVMVASYAGRTKDVIVGTAPAEDSATQAGVGFTVDVSTVESLL